uniref:Uncharacterized protein n=1 Tax=Salix viminalis TaxID=40686 RepID=A0A6N2NHC5_SALVM
MWFNISFIQHVSAQSHEFFPHFGGSFSITNQFRQDIESAGGWKRTCKWETAGSVQIATCRVFSFQVLFFSDDTCYMVLNFYSTFLGCSCLKFRYCVISNSNWQPSKLACYLCCLVFTTHLSLPGNGN